MDFWIDYGPWYNNLAGDFPYFLTVIDEVNCTHEETIFVPEIEVPEIVDIQVENVLCNNTATGSIVVDVIFHFIYIYMDFAWRWNSSGK